MQQLKQGDDFGASQRDAAMYVTLASLSRDVTKALSRRAGTKALPPLSNEAIASLGRACVWGVGGSNEVG